MRREPDEHGFALILVLVTFLIIELIGVGALAVATSNLHGAVASRLAMEAANVAEAGVNYAVAQLVARASMVVPTDENYAGELGDIGVPGPDGTVGIFRVTVTCIYPQNAVPPDCQDDPSTPGIDARNFRHIVSVGFVPGRPGRARRQIEATVRRYTTREVGTPAYGVCGRGGVDLEQGTTITSDVGSDGDIRVGGLSAIRQWHPIPPPSPATATRVPAATSTGGLTGAYSWRVTFLDSLGRESGGSPPTRPLVLAGEYARLTDIATGDTSITKRRIYRTRANAAATGPWYLIAELPDNATRTYTDPQADTALGFRIPGTIAGNAVAGGRVNCLGGCGAQVDGKVQSLAHEVICPAFLPPPCQPGVDRAPGLITQDAPDQIMHWGALHVDAGDTLSILTRGDPHARLDIHVSDIDLAPDAMVVITGQATVYFHVSGRIHLGERAVFGVEDENPTGTLIAPSDRIQILSCAHDTAYDPTRPETASVRWDRENRISAFLFAPDANIVIDRAGTLRGAVYGNHVRIIGSTDPILDPTEGPGSERAGIRPSPFQYVVRWYDNPSPRR